MSGLAFEIGSQEARVLAGPYIIAEIAVDSGGRWRERRDGVFCAGYSLGDASLPCDSVRMLLFNVARDYVDRYKVWLVDYEKRAAAARAEVRQLEDRAWMVDARLNALRAALEEE